MSSRRDAARDALLEEHAWNELREQRVLAESLRTFRARRRPRRTPTRRMWNAAALTCVAAIVASVATFARMPSAPWARSRGVARETAAPPAETLALADGSLVTYGTGARLQVSEASLETVRIRQLVGEATYDVSHVPTRRFVVDAADVEITVRGTRFTVALDDASVSVTVREGVVDVDDGEGVVKVPAGEVRRVAAWRPDRVRAPAREPPESRAGVRDAGDAEPAPKRQSAHEKSFDTLFAEANESRARGDYRDAAVKLRLLLERRPDRSREGVTLFVLGRVERSRGDAVASASAFAACARVTPNDDLREDALAEAAESWVKAEDSARAVSVADEYLAAYPRGAHAARMRAISP